MGTRDLHGLKDALRVPVGLSRHSIYIPRLVQGAGLGPDRRSHTGFGSRLPLPHLEHRIFVWGLTQDQIFSLPSPGWLYHPP